MAYGWWPVVVVAIFSKAVILWLLVHFLVVLPLCDKFLLFCNIVVFYYLVLKSSDLEKKSWLLYFYCVIAGIWLSVLCATSSMRRGYVFGL